VSRLFVLGHILRLNADTKCDRSAPDDPRSDSGSMETSSDVAPSSNADAMRGVLFGLATRVPTSPEHFVGDIVAVFEGFAIVASLTPRIAQPQTPRLALCCSLIGQGRIGVVAKTSSVSRSRISIFDMMDCSFIW
jgi:hypothetical protein